MVFAFLKPTSEAMCRVERFQLNSFLRLPVQVGVIPKGPNTGIIVLQGPNTFNVIFLGP